MPRDRLTYRQRDLSVALKTIKAAGLSVTGVEVERDGGFKIITGAATELDENAIETGTRHIDEVIANVFTEKGPQVKERSATLRVARAKPPRQR